MTIINKCLAVIVAGTSVYAASDVIVNYYTFQTLYPEAMKFAQDHAGLKNSIGFPYQSSDHWYQANFDWTPSMHSVSITFPLKGPNGDTEVNIKGARKPSSRSLFITSLLGDTDWKLQDCSAMFKIGSKGFLRPRSLLPFELVPEVLNGKVVEGEYCESCSLNNPGGCK